jgi:hypothetical protein
MDSALAPNRGGFVGQLSHLARPDDATSSTAVAPGQGFLHTTKGFLNAGTEIKDRGLGATLSASYTVDWRSGDNPTWDHGNLVALVGLRHASLAYAEALRLGWALRVGTGIQVSGTDDSRETNRRAAAAPFDVMSLAVDRPIAVSFEARAELRGCYGQFAHLRADMILWKADLSGANRRAQESVGIWPMTLTVGGYFMPRTALAVSLGYQLTANGQGVFPANVTRLEITGHFEKRGHLDLFFEPYVAGVSGAANGAQAGLRVGGQW